MKVRDEITLHAAEEHKPVLHWLFDRYHWESQWRFVAVCSFKKYGTQSYASHRIWAPTKEGRALYEWAKLHGGEFALPETLPVPEPEPPRKLLETHEKLSDTLTLSNCTDGFWLHDKTRGMNLSIRAKTPIAAFVEALTYYQGKLMTVEEKHTELQKRVEAFVEQFTDREE